MTLRTPSTLQFKWNAMDRLWMPVVTGPFNFIYKQRLLTNLRKLGPSSHPLFILGLCCFFFFVRLRQRKKEA